MDIENCIIAALASTADELRGKNERDAIWTLKLKLQLIAYKPIECSARTTGHGSSEYLYDLVWVKGDPIDGPIRDLVMALECEWTYRNVLYDFRKLLLARADIRVMIFQGNTLERLEAIGKMQDEIEQFAKTQKGDRYLFACWDCEPSPGQRNFVYESYMAKKPAS